MSGSEQDISLMNLLFVQKDDIETSIYKADDFELYHSIKDGTIIWTEIFDFEYHLYSMHYTMIVIQSLII